MFAPMEWNDYYRHYIKELQGIYPLEEASAIAALVFENKAAMPRTGILKSGNEPVSGSLKKKLDDALQELMRHKPVQHIVGEAWFYHLKLTVNEHVLIPRPETEELVQWIIDDNANRKENFSILDIGTGSGCIPIALKKKLPLANVVSLDISNDALDTAKQNAATNRAVIEFLLLDFLSEKEWQRLPMFDLIVSNPPYIPLNEKGKLDRNVTGYEPHTALFVPENNPLVFYEAINSFATTHLTPDGKIYVETHEDYARETAAVFSKQFKTAELKKDINGKERMVKVIQCP